MELGSPHECADRSVPHPGHFDSLRSLSLLCSGTLLVLSIVTSASVNKVNSRLTSQRLELEAKNTDNSGLSRDLLERKAGNDDSSI